METAVIVAIPEAAPAIDDVRLVHTTAGADGVPAHVTILYPFIDSDQLTDADIGIVAAIAASFEPFVLVLAELRWFDGSPNVLYLAPDPAGPFVAMTSAVADAFPDYPPYGGGHDEPIPHLTVAEGDRTTLAELERDVAPRLPVTASVSEAALFQRNPAGRWQLRERFPLAGRPS
jgi:2'-5' RNA ligase superfamily